MMVRSSGGADILAVPWVMIDRLVSQKQGES
jgi:hypothetical protein